MSFRYQCDNRKRIGLVRNHATLNGIDYLEVLDRDAPAGSPKQRTLLVRGLKDFPAPPDALTADNISISGGVRVTDVKIEWAARGAEIDALFADGLINSDEHTYFGTLADPTGLLIVRTNTTGDFSTYTLRLVSSGIDDDPPENFDTILSCIDFSFKVECPSEFDCADDLVCPPERRDEPDINYLAKDYNSFRGLMFDRTSVLMPDWDERNPADFGVAMVELMAYVGDYLSYYQDAVATEAYLGTARRRASVRRHAKLLDYSMHDGCNARTWLAFEVSGADGDGGTLPAGSPFSTAVEKEGDEAVVFETMHDLTLRSAHDAITIYTWQDTDCCLPAGSTKATLVDPGLSLGAGDVIVFEEFLESPPDDCRQRFPERTHAARLVRTQPTTDPLTGTALLEVEWHAEDALPFPLCISSTDADGGTVEGLTLVRGNVVLADHGASMVGQEPVPAIVPSEGRYRPTLQEAGISFGVAYDHETAEGRSANDALLQEPRKALPLMRLNDGDEYWLPQASLLASDRFATEFVAEPSNDGIVTLRFGDDTLGKAPSAGVAFTADYRVGGGSVGNVGRNTVAEYRGDLFNPGCVWNPMAAIGGVDPELPEEVRQYAPEAFRTQRRAVTTEDYVRLAEEHPQVQKAAARFRWTGSWYTVFVTVDRIGGASVDDDPDFESEIRDWLDRFRVAGYDLEITGPIFVPLDIAMSVCVETGYFRSDIKLKLLEVFSRYDLRDGTRGFFHPDNFTFGQTLYLSSMYERAMSVEGVASVEVTRMQRWTKKENGEIDAGKLTTAPLEIIRLDNDPSAPENGKIEFTMQGGL